MTAPYGKLPPPQPRFRRPVVSAGKRRLRQSLLHMSFLLAWIGVMLGFTPLGSWAVNWLESRFALAPDQSRRRLLVESARNDLRQGRPFEAVGKLELALHMVGPAGCSELELYSLLGNHFLHKGPAWKLSNLLADRLAPAGLAEELLEKPFHSPASPENFSTLRALANYDPRLKSRAHSVIERWARSGGHEPQFQKSLERYLAP